MGKQDYEYLGDNDAEGQEDDAFYRLGFLAGPREKVHGREGAGEEGGADEESLPEFVSEACQYAGDHDYGYAPVGYED